MATTRRGTNQYTNATAATSFNIPLPSGSVAGDWVIVGAANNDNTRSMSISGATSLYGAGTGSMYAYIGKKQLTSTDITNGYLTISGGSSFTIAAGIVGYSASGGFGTLGTVTAKPGSQATTSALGVSSDGSQDVLVFSLTKHSGNPQTFTSDSPSTTTLVNAILSGGGVPAIHIGVFTSSSTNVTSTWGVASTNGVGAQVAVTQSTPTNPTVSVWNGTSEITGCTVSVWNGTSEVTGSTVSSVV